MPNERHPTLIELTIIVVVLGIIASVVLPWYHDAQQRAAAVNTSQALSAVAARDTVSLKTYQKYPAVLRAQVVAARSFVEGQGEYLNKADWNPQAITASADTILTGTYYLNELRKVSQALGKPDTGDLGGVVFLLRHSLATVVAVRVYSYGRDSVTSHAWTHYTTDKGERLIVVLDNELDRRHLMSVLDHEFKLSPQSRWEGVLKVLNNARRLHGR